MASLSILKLGQLTWIIIFFPQFFRFLYSDPAINYQADNFLVPLDTGILTTKEMLITVTEESILRIYTEATTAVDIDLKLYMSLGANQTWEQVATANNGIYNEEVIVAKLVPDVSRSSTTISARYMLKVLFWKWNFETSDQCQTFNMEIAVTPVSMIGTFSQACPHGGTCSF